MNILRDKKSRSVFFQILAVAGVVGIIYFAIAQMFANLEVLGLSIDFSFLHYPSGYDIHQSLIAYDSTSTHLDAAIVGLLNTALVAFFGIIFASILGFTIGVMRLSKNFVINRIALAYIEIMRNIPVLLHILLVYGVVVYTLPKVKNSIDLGMDFFLSNRGLVFPRPIYETGSGYVFAAMALAFVFAIGFAWFSRYRQKVTGQILPVLWINLGVIVLVPLAVYYMAGQPVRFEIPVLKGFNFKGGMNIRPEFLALWIALSIYTAAFIAEIVRSGIQAVSHGQTEAALALGVRRNRTLQLVVIPQALRVIIPPLTSQYLNLTKNSSLAIAVGYLDVTGTLGKITLNQTGRAIESMLILMSIYLVFSISISLFMNWYNNHIKLVER